MNIIFISNPYYYTVGVFIAFIILCDSNRVTPHITPFFKGRDLFVQCM